MTDPDARSMATSGRGSGMVGYNVQMVVEAKHDLIVAHEVTNRGHDRDSLASMTQAAWKAMGKKRLRAIADRGYYSAPQIKVCAETGIDAILPKPTTSNAKAEGRFDRSDFIYIAKDDEYQCLRASAPSTGLRGRGMVFNCGATGVVPARNAL